jgi:PAS domain S-box-containing protein
MILAFVAMFVATAVATELITVWGIPFTPFQGQVESTKDEAAGQLDLIADLKSSRLNRMIQERRDDVATFADSKWVRTHIGTLIDRERSLRNEGIEGDALRDQLVTSQAHTLLTDFLRTIDEAFEAYTSLLIADVQTRTVLAATSPSEVAESIVLEDFLFRDLGPEQTYVSNVAVCRRTNRPSMHIARSINALQADGQTDQDVIAVLLVEVDPGDLLDPVMAIAGMLGDTGEAFLIDENHRLLTRLKEKPLDADRAKPLEYKIHTPLTAEFKQRHGEIVEGKDYRGEQVLATLRFLQIGPEWGWGLVVKRDLDEVMATTRSTIIRSVIVTIIGLSFMVLLTVLLARSLTDSLTELSAAASELQAGDLDRRANVQSNDEIAALANVFNSMAAEIQTRRRELEQKVQQRTAELDRTNRDLEREIREHQRAEEGLRNSEERFRAIVESTTDCIMVWDQQYNYLYANQASIDHVGTTRRQVIGKNMRDGLGHVPKMLERWKRRVDEAFRTGDSLFVEDELELDGRTVYSESTISPLRAQTGEIFAVGVVYRDVTERKRAQAELSKLNQMLLAKNEELESIVFVASHDLRSPLVNVQGFSRELQMSCDQLRELLEQPPAQPTLQRKIDQILNKDINESLEFIRAGVSKMDRLLNGLLRLSRLGRAGLRMETIDMNTLVSNALKAMDYQIQEGGVKIDVEDLPPCFGDETQISQVFSNLIDNAVKYRHHGRDSWVRIQGEASGEYVCYHIEDNGIGIPKGRERHIFEIFQRENVPDIQGEGLGLTIARRIIDRHDGSISARSQEGQGSVFTITLPRGSG